MERDTLRDFQILCLSDMELGYNEANAARNMNSHFESNIFFMESDYVFRFETLPVKIARKKIRKTIKTFN